MSVTRRARYAAGLLAALLPLAVSVAGCAGPGVGSAGPATVTVTVEATATTGPVTPSPAAAPRAPTTRATGGPTAPGVPSAAATQVRVLRPITADGSLAPGWTIDMSSATAPIDCSSDEGSPSAVGPGTHGCGDTTDSCQAAFTSAKHPGLVLCLYGAWDTVLHARKAQGLPGHPAAAPATPEPLGLELVDGTRWWRRIGGAWGGRADDYVGAYGCASPSCGPAGKDIVVLVKDQPAVDRSTPVWTVKVGELGDPSKSYPPPVTVGVWAAWFIAAS